jgi:F-type H+-transporting ATPase subunit a
MEHQQLWFTALLNSVFGGPIGALLTAIGQPPADPAHPIANHFAMQVLAALILMGILGVVRVGVSMDRPGKLQQFFELLIEGIDGMLEEIMGHGGRTFIPMLFTLALFIFLSNILGIIPSLETPTDQIAVTLGLALVSFVYYNYWGIHHHGVFGYIKASFMGPMMAIAPLMLPIEIVSHLARVLSLSVRLMANMIAGHNITLIFMGLVPLGLPIMFEGLHLAVGALQAYVFVMLTAVYLAGAVAEEH